MTEKELILETLRRMGQIIAAGVQTRSAEMNGTQLNAEREYIPRFADAVKTKNMMNRKAGQTDGFVCKSTAGRVVRLIQNYDSSVHTGEPEELSAQWRFVWSTDPQKALPFVSISTSPFAKGDCCTHDGHVWRSGQDGNVWAPGTVGVSWEDLGTVDEIM